MVLRFPLPSRVCAQGALLVLASCGASHHDAEVDVADARAPDAGAPGADVDAAAADVGVEADAAALPDASIAQAVFQLGASDCSQELPGIAVRSARRVLVTTACGFYAVDTLANKVEQLEARGASIDQDGDTVAVLAGKLGLSRDGGETFAWTDWHLVRCPGSPRVHAGDGFAVIGCVGGVGRWRGEGSSFEELVPGGTHPVAAGVAVGGTRVVIQDTMGWYHSSDGGDSFQPLAVDGLPGRVQESAMEIADATLWIPAQPDAEEASALYATTLGSGVFARLSALPVPGAVVLRHSHGALIVAGTRTALSADRGMTFREPPLQAVEGFQIAADYLDGRLYRVAKNKLYVDALQP